MLVHVHAPLSSPYNRRDSSPLLFPLPTPTAARAVPLLRWRAPPPTDQYVAIAPTAADCELRIPSAERHCTSPPAGFFQCVQDMYRAHPLAVAQWASTRDGKAATSPHPASPAAAAAPGTFAVYTNAQFGVTRDRIWARPLEAYERLLASFERDDAQSCYHVGGPKGRPHRGTCAVLEFLWPTMLGEAPILDTRRTMTGLRADAPLPWETGSWRAG